MTLLRINNRILKKNGIVLAGTSGEPPTPSLPPYTIRLKFTEGVTPTFDLGTAVQVSSSPNVWDLTYESVYNSWGSLLYNHMDLVEVIDANTTGITDMSYMFEGCQNLTTVPLFDTSSVTNMRGMFYYCESLTNVPLFDTSNVTVLDQTFGNCGSLTSIPLIDTSKCTSMAQMCFNCRSITTIPLFDTTNCLYMDQAFYCCYNVQTGAYALYVQADSQGTVQSHYNTFADCGSNTTTGSAELEQIPADWR